MDVTSDDVSHKPFDNVVCCSGKRDIGGTSAVSIDNRLVSLSSPLDSHTMISAAAVMFLFKNQRNVR